MYSILNLVFCRFVQVVETGLLENFNSLSELIFMEKLFLLRKKQSKISANPNLAYPIDLGDMFRNVISFLLIGLFLSVSTFIIEIMTQLCST